MTLVGAPEEKNLPGSAFQLRMGRHSLSGYAMDAFAKPEDALFSATNTDHRRTSKNPHPSKSTTPTPGP